MLRRSDIDETERLEDIDCPSCNVREPQGGPCIMEDEAENGYTEVKISLAVSHQVRPRQLALPSVSWPCLPSVWEFGKSGTSHFVQYRKVR